MTSKEIVKDIMEKQGKTNAEMADALGISPQALWDRLNNKKAKDLSVSVLSDMLRSLGYKVCIVPRNARISEDGYKVE